MQAADAQRRVQPCDQALGGVVDRDRQCAWNGKGAARAHPRDHRHDRAAARLDAFDRRIHLSRRGNGLVVGDGECDGLGFGDRGGHIRPARLRDRKRARLGEHIAEIGRRAFGNHHHRTQ